jgi:hypothetical protein
VDQSQLLIEILGLLRNMNESSQPGESLNDKNVLQSNNPSDPNKKVKPTLTSSEQKRTTEIATIFAKTFLNYQKKMTPDTALKTSISKITPTTPNQNQIEDKAKPAKPGMAMMGILALLGGAGALLLGLLDDGPFKGALKILSKIGISGGAKMFMKGASGFLKTISKFITAPFKAVGKLFKGGIIAKMLSAFKPLLKVLKKIPLIGNIISIGFAISRFKKGDTIGGIIDTLSALTGLLYLIPGGAIVALPLSIGLDILNAWLDVKTAGAKDKNKAKGDILKDMVSGIGDWIEKNALWLPVIGGFKRWGMAIDEFKSGNIVEGLKQVGMGLFAFVGGSAIVKGIEALMGFFGGEKSEEKDLTPNKNWFANFKKWLKERLKSLPYVLRKPLEWFGILDSEGDVTFSSQDVKDGVMDAFGKVREFASGLWNDIWNGVKSGFNWIGEKFNSVYDKIKGAFESLMETISTGFENIKKFITGFISKITGYVKNLWPFGGGDDKKTSESLTETQKESLKKSGWNTWKEYENSGWKYKTNNDVTPTSEVKSVVVVDKPDNLVKLNEIEKHKIKGIYDIRTITIEILKSINNMNSGGSNPVILPISSQSSPGQSDNTVPMSINRGNYGSSPYSLA